jgi:hypothetical protein
MRIAKVGFDGRLKQQKVPDTRAAWLIAGFSAAWHYEGLRAFVSTHSPTNTRIVPGFCALKYARLVAIADFKCGTDRPVRIDKSYHEQDTHKNATV